MHSQTAQTCSFEITEGVLKVKTAPNTDPTLISVDKYLRAALTFNRLDLTELIFYLSMQKD